MSTEITEITKQEAEQVSGGSLLGTIVEIIVDAVADLVRYKGPQA